MAKLKFNLYTSTSVVVVIFMLMSLSLVYKFCCIFVYFAAIDLTKYIYYNKSLTALHMQCLVKKTCH
jgi:hypothetical protein